MPDSNPADWPKCPASARNAVRHATGTVSAITPESRPSWTGARNRKGQVTLPHVRHWTVGYRHPYDPGRYTDKYGAPAAHRRPEPPPMPFLPLQGRWLHKAGFAIGTPVRVVVAPGRLVLEVDEEAVRAFP
jgi:hypothetical protein